MTDLMTPPETPVATNENPDTDLVTQYIGDGKKWKDTQTVIQAKLESDKYISDLKAELARKEAELNTRTKMEDFLTQMSTLQTRTFEQPEPTGSQEPKAGLSVDEVRNLVGAELAEAQKRARENDNTLTVQNELMKTFGSQFPDHVRRKAAELEVGEQFMRDLAKANPKAFMSLMGTPVPAQKFAAPPVTTERLSGFTPSAGTRNRSYYDKLRVSNPKGYRSDAVQSQMHQDALALGWDEFNK